MHIFYIGTMSPSSTTYHRALALKRLGHSLTSFDTKTELGSSLNGKYRNAFHYRSGYAFLQKKIYNLLKEKLLSTNSKFDVIWIDSGEYFGVKPLKLLRQYCEKIVLYCVDDITGSRDGNRFKTAKKALPYYTLCTTPRRYVVDEFKQLGVKHVHTFWRSYDELVHQPFENRSDIPTEYLSDVVFVGTLIPGENRDEFIYKLVQRGVNVSIWGSNWQSSPYWEKIKSHWKGKAVYGRDYTAAIQGAKICLGFLSKGNRDLHTRRSAEIPFSGGLFCAERTEEHLEMFEEGKEAVFWADADECAAICNDLIRDDQLRESIREAGMKKIRNMPCSNEKVVADIITKLNTL